MTGGVEFSSSSESSHSDTDDSDSIPELRRYFQVDHTTTAQARAALLAPIRISPLPFPPSTAYHPPKPSGHRDDAKTVIRNHFSWVPSVQKWGFAILRCTYSSETSWKVYLERIRDHIADRLNFEKDADLRDRLEILVFESEGALDGRSWKEARDVFDAWVLEDIKSHSEYRDDLLKGQEGENGRDLHFAVGRSPRTEFFIYADEGSVESVVDCGNHWKDIEKPGAYYFTIVATGLKTPRVYHARKDGTPVKDYEESEGTREALRQKWKANQYVKLYSYCLDDNWPEIHEVDGGGVSRCF